MLLLWPVLGALSPLPSRARSSILRHSQTGPRDQPKKSAARDLIVELRKRNYSVYEISETLKERERPLSATAVREVLKAEGLAPLPRRGDEERPQRPRATIEPVADARRFVLTPGQFQTRCGGLFLFVPQLFDLSLDALSSSANLPGSKMIPATHVLRACLALKLWSIQSKSHVMALVADVDFDMALLVIASGLYQLLARKMGGYADAQARVIFRDLIDMPTTVDLTENEVQVRFHRRAHLPIVLASGLLDKPIGVPWWNDMRLRLTA